MSGRRVVVTGIGLVSCAGEGVEAHLSAFATGEPPLTDTESFVPFPVHPAVKLNLDTQIPKKSDQRQMEPWQRLGVYAAGLALDSAGVKDDAAFKSALHLIVACGGGERDYAVDGAILTGLRGAENPGAYLNDHLLNDLRPTLFLAQLSNLLAGNIAIVHGVTGASRTFMGEEVAGVDALRIAHARIASGQVEAVMVGGSYNAERADVLVINEMGGFLQRDAYRPVYTRGGEDRGGYILASGAAFLLLESAEQAEARGARALAAIDAVASDSVRRAPGSAGASLRRLVGDAGFAAPDLVLSTATGIADLADEEAAALRAALPDVPIRATGDVVGHPIEAVAPFGAALGAALCEAGKAREIAVTCIGHRRGEGVVRVSAAWMAMPLPDVSRRAKRG